MSVKKIHLFPSEESYVTNSGSVEADDLALVPLNLSFNNLSDRPKAYVTETWRSGAQWYRKWSDGWIEQGGSGTINECSTLTVSLNCAMATKNYTAMITNTSGKTSGNTEGCLFVKTKGTATIVFSCGYIDPNASPFDWYVCGY